MSKLVRRPDVNRRIHTHGPDNDYLQDCYVAHCRECSWTLCVTWYPPSTPERAEQAASNYADGHMKHCKGRDDAENADRR